MRKINKIFKINNILSILKYYIFLADGINAVE